MASNVIEELPKRQTLFDHTRKLIEDAERITSLVNESNLFKSPFTIECKYKMTERGGSIVVSFNLNKDTFASSEFYNHSSIVEPYIDVVILYVKSDIGYGTGFFLFYLQLLLCYIENIQQITLENETDDSLRAAKSIYGEFNVNKRGVNRSEFMGKTLKEQLYIAEHKMRRVMSSDFLHSWSKVLIKLNKKAISTPESPWEPNYLHNLNTFFFYLRSIFSQVQGLSSVPKNYSESASTPMMKYPKSTKSLSQHSIINKTRKQKPAKGGYLISKKSLRKMAHKLQHTRKRQSKKKQMNKRKSKRNSVSRRNKSKSYGGGLSGSKPLSEEKEKQETKIITPYYTNADAMVDLKKAVMEGKYKKVEKLLEKYPTLQTGDYGVWINPDNINNDEITTLLRSYGFFNVAYNSNNNSNINSNINSNNNNNIPNIKPNLKNK